MTKFVFVTGGVVSSLGKGIASASLAAILESRGLKVTLIKLDPYINVDPGTMSPTVPPISTMATSTASVVPTPAPRWMYSWISLVTCGMTCTVLPR